MRILIAYDGSICADGAIADLDRAGLPEKAEVMVVTVAEVWLQPPPSSYEILEAPYCDAATARGLARRQEQNQIDAACSIAFQAAKRLELSHPQWEIRHGGHCGSPASTILRLADSFHADLIVVGSHGRSALGRFVLGSISQKVVTHSHCSVRVARGHPNKPGAPIRILIGVDGSRGSQEAIRAVALRNWPERTEARMVAVHDALIPAPIGQFMPPITGKLYEESAENTWIDKLVDASRRELEEAGIIVSSQLLPGDPRSGLIEAAREWAVDCIFLGARGLSRLDRFLLGSVSAAIAARAESSVEIVQAPAQKHVP
jgi:nucleotide-binding universal stress UspA family protein